MSADYAGTPCQTADPTTFDPHVAGERVGQARLRIARAQTLCRRCPAKLTCLAEAYTNNDSGVRGGLLLHNGTPTDLPGTGGRQKRPRPSLSPCGTHAAFQRHGRRGETLDEVCVAAERDYQRETKRHQRQRSAA